MYSNSDGQVNDNYTILNADGAVRLVELHKDDKEM